MTAQSKKSRGALVWLRHWQSSIPSGCQFDYNDYQLKAQDGASSQVMLHWESSSKPQATTSFLDLPRELRDQIYVCVRNDLHCIRRQTPVDVESVSSGSTSSTQPSSCALMRSCRQVHSEFAETLYSTAIEFRTSSPGSYIVPIRPLYFGLVKNIVFEVNVPLYQHPPCKLWRRSLCVANALSDMLPDAQLSVGWQMRLTYRPAEYEEWAVFNGTAEGTRESHIKAVENFIRSLKSMDRMSIPHNFELLQRYAGKDVHTPFKEAARNLRRRPPKYLKT